MGRKYELKQRATSQEQTRRRIVEAAVALHESVGGAAATVTAIADRAGVGRLTVYRHFPDERALLQACTSHYLTLNPPPNPAGWEEIADPDERLRTALGSLYAFYRKNEKMLARADQEAPANPVLAEALAPYAAYLGQVRDGLLDAFTDPAAPDPIVRAVIGHALDFSTWHSLGIEHGLDDEQAVCLMVKLVRCTAG